MNADDRGNARFLFTVVCDDVRQEVGNKMSLMGIYESAIFVERFPAVIPHLFFVMKARTPASRPFGQLRFIIRRDEEILVEAPVNNDGLAVPEELAPGVAEDLRSDPAVRAITVNAVIGVGPLTIEKPCSLSIRAMTESEELRGGTFFISLAKPQKRGKHSNAE